MKTKILAMLLPMFFLFPSSVVMAEFSDVTSTHPNKTAIDFVQNEGIVEGYKDGTYHPDSPINRAEFIKIVVFALVGQEPIEEAGQCFSDVASGVWFYPYVCYAERVGIVGGYADGSFKPERNISFVESAKIISIAFGSPARDVAVGEEWYSQFVSYLGEKKAIPISISALDKELTRGEMAEIIYRIKGNVTSLPSKVLGDFGSAGVLTKEIKTFDITAKKFEFVPSVITVKEGDMVRLNVNSIDVNHGIAIPDFGVNDFLKPGEMKVIEFTADKAGVYSFFCSVYCGSDHSMMKGTLIVE